MMPVNNLPETLIMKNKNEQATQTPVEFDAVFTEKDVFKIEGEYNTTWGVSRRIMMMVLSKSSADLSNIFKSIIADDDTGRVYFEMLEQIDDYKEHLKSGMELADAAAARLLMVATQVEDIDVKLA
jgi:hypothetical protein